jgi:hypothetical protein
MKTNPEYEQFNRTMDSILRADPKAVKAAVDEEVQTNTAEREARGERKRGRKPKVQKRDK